MQIVQCVRLAAVIVTCVVVLVLPGFAQAQQNYPNKPIRLIAPVAEGGNPDITARLSASEIDRAFDLDHHLRHTGAIIDRALAE